MFSTSQFLAMSLHQTFVLAPTPDPDFYPAEVQLAEELSASLPAGVAIQPLPTLSPADFETIYAWFLA